MKLPKVFLNYFNDMQRFLLLQIVSFTLCFASCQNISKSAFLKNDYVIPDSVFYKFDTIKHFSLIELGGDVLDRQYPYFTDEFEVLYRWKVYRCKDSDHLKLFQNQCLQSAVYVVNPTDSLFFTFDNEHSLKLEYDTVVLESLFENIPDCGHLIPNFNNIFDYLSYGKNLSRFSPDSLVIYVLKFGDSFILPQDYQYSWNLLPGRIQHGYTSGVAFCKSAPDYVYSWSIAW